jgi:hypothetical protein
MTFAGAINPHPHGTRADLHVPPPPGHNPGERVMRPIAARRTIWPQFAGLGAIFVGIRVPKAPRTDYQSGGFRRIVAAGCRHVMRRIQASQDTPCASQ